MLFHRFSCDPLAQACYLLADGDEALIVDPLRDVDDVLAFAAARGLRVRQVIATHVHADFVAGLGEVAAATGARIRLGERFHGALACERLADDEELRIGGLRIRVLPTPGHTRESISLFVLPPASSDAPSRLLSGDTLFVGDVGRPDLSQGEGGTPRAMAMQLFASLRERIAPLPNSTEIWPAHGAGSACGSGIGTATSSTLGAERLGNWALAETDPERFCDRLLAALRPPPRYFASVAAQNRAGPALLGSLPIVRQISIHMTRQAVAKGACVLDVRSCLDFGKGHWPDAQNVGLEGGEFEAWAGELLDPVAPLVIHAGSADEAQSAVRRLRRIGCERVAGFVLALPDAVQRVPQIEAIDLFAPTGAAWQVIDVRRPAEYAAGHVPGAVACELGAAMPVVMLGRLDRARPTAVLCEGGYRSSAALGQLRAAGFTDLHNVHDGMRGWRGNHLPQVSGPAATATSS